MLGFERSYGDAEKYKQYTDEQLLHDLRDGETAIMDYIMEKYKYLVRGEAKAMYLLGGESDDLIQEGMIGLFKAVQNYDTGQSTSFYSFAKLCIRRQMYSAITASKRKKHIPLNSYVSLYEQADEDGAGRMLDVIEAGEESNPEQAMIRKEYMENLGAALEKELSALERSVLYLHLMGSDYRTIARLLHKSPKAIDNALQRIKKKVGKAVREGRRS